MPNNTSNIPEYVYIHNISVNKAISSTLLNSDDFTIISIDPLTENAVKVKLSTIKKKCYINGYGIYEP